MEFKVFMVTIPYQTATRINRNIMEFKDISGSNWWRWFQYELIET